MYRIFPSAVKSAIPVSVHYARFRVKRIVAIPHRLPLGLLTRYRYPKISHAPALSAKKSVHNQFSIRLGLVSWLGWELGNFLRFIRGGG